VIGTLPADEARPPGIATGAVIGERSLERSFDCFGAGVHKEHPVQPGRQDTGKLARQGEAIGVSELERGAKSRWRNWSDTAEAISGRPWPAGTQKSPETPSSNRRPPAST